MHDWYSKTGQGVGAEYRYNGGGGSNGNLRGYTLEEQLGTNPKERSYTVVGDANHLLPGNFRAQARVNYFSSITDQPDPATSTSPTPRATTGTTAATSSGRSADSSVTGTFDRNEWFNDVTNSGVTGSAPRIAIAKNERPLFTGSPVYFSLGSEFVDLVRQTRANGVVTDDRSLTRFDVTPQVRYPFKRWSFFTVNSTASWRETYYTRSLDPATAQGRSRTT